MPCVDQTLEKLEQNRNVVEMEARCRLIENEQIAANGRIGDRRDFAAIAGPRCAPLYQMTDKLQALGFATA